MRLLSIEKPAFGVVGPERLSRVWGSLPSPRDNHVPTQCDQMSTPITRLVVRAAGGLIDTGHRVLSDRAGLGGILVLRRSTARAGWPRGSGRAFCSCRRCSPTSRASCRLSCSPAPPAAPSPRPRPARSRCSARRACCGCAASSSARSKRAIFSFLCWFLSVPRRTSSWRPCSQQLTGGVKNVRRPSSRLSSGSRTRSPRSAAARAPPPRAGAVAPPTAAPR